MQLSSCQSAESQEKQIQLSDSQWCWSASRTDNCRFELELTRLTNEFRSRHGLAPLQHQPELAYVSYQQARRAAQAGGISHAGFPQQRQAILDGVSPDSGLRIRAENLLSMKPSRFEPELLAQRSFYHWQKSPRHRAQLLGPYRGHGASVYRMGEKVYAAAMFD